MNKNIFPIQELGDKRIIAAGPLSKQPSTVPYRIVLLEYGNGSLSVHHQMFNSVDNLAKGSFAHGHYFQKDQIADATKKFAEKVTEHSGYLNSTLRNG